MRPHRWLFTLLLIWAAGLAGLSAQEEAPAAEVAVPADPAPTSTPRFVRGTAATNSAAGTDAAPVPRIAAQPAEIIPPPTQRTTRQAHFEYDAATRTLVVTTDPATNTQVESVIKALDQPVPQALIKVLFLEVIYNHNDDLGVDLKYTKTKANGHSTVLESVFGAAAVSQGGIATILHSDIQATIAAISERDKTNVLSRPSILARNNQQATITIGQTVPLVTDSRTTTNGDTINSVQYQDVGIILTVTPHIRSDGTVELDVAPQISALSAKTVQISATVNAPVIDKRSADTHVVIPSGQTIVIGGLMSDQDTETVRKVPLLGDIPLLGIPFKRTIKTKEKTELLIFLTPEVVNSNAQLVDLATSEASKADNIRSGTPPATLQRYVELPPAAPAPAKPLKAPKPAPATPPTGAAD